MYTYPKCLGQTNPKAGRERRADHETTGYVSWAASSGLRLLAGEPSHVQPAMRGVS